MTHYLGSKKRLCLAAGSAAWHAAPHDGADPSEAALLRVSFYLLAPLSLQLVKRQPLTNPAVILENSLLAGIK